MIDPGFDTKHADTDPARCALGNQLFRSGNFHDALKVFSGLSAEYPNAAYPHFRTAEVLVRLGRYEEALPLFREVTALAPNWLDAKEVYGRALWICRRPEEAKSVWRTWRTSQEQAARGNGLNRRKLRVLGSPWTGWLGNNAHLDAYLKIKALGWDDDADVAVLAEPGKVANACYLNYWANRVRIIRPDNTEYSALSSAMPVLGDRLQTFFISGRPTYFLDAIAIAQDEWERQGRVPLLKLREEHGTRGRAELSKLGLPPGAWYVCLHVRESGFWKEEGDPSNRPRTANVATYFRAIEHITQKGGWVIRMGDPSMVALPPMPNVIDYAHSACKSDWMDIFLCASCRFLIATNSALYWVCISFGVPALLTNWLPLSIRPVQRHDLLVPKLLYSAQKRRLLTVREMLALPRDIWSGWYYNGTGLTVRDNSDDELAEATREMLDAKHAAAGADSQGSFDAAMTQAKINGRGKLCSYFGNKWKQFLN